MLKLKTNSNIYEMAGEEFYVQWFLQEEMMLMFSMFPFPFFYFLLIFLVRSSGEKPSHVVVLRTSTHYYFFPFLIVFNSNLF